MIKTKTVRLSKNKFLGIILLRYLKRRWYLILAVLLLGLFISQKEHPEKIDIFFISICFLYPLLIIIQFWTWVNSKQNKIFLTDRMYEIDEDKITGRTNSISFSTVEKKHFIKNDLILKTYLLYISKGQFFYIPLDSFESEQDRIWFEQNYIDPKE